MVSVMEYIIMIKIKENMFYIGLENTNILEELVDGTF